jgi:hypothetical protein
VQLGHGGFGQVAAFVLDVPFVMVFGRDGSGEAFEGGGVGEHADHVCAAFDLAVESFGSSSSTNRVGASPPGSVLTLTRQMCAARSI